MSAEMILFDDAVFSSTAAGYCLSKDLWDAASCAVGFATAVFDVSSTSFLFCISEIICCSLPH
jgi:hypothetical protein